MLLKVSCNANWAVCCPSVALSSVLTFIYWQSHFRPASSMPVGFCLSSLARHTHPICQALLVMSLNECGRHKASSVETDSFLLEPMSAILVAASRCQVCLAPVRGGRRAFLL